MKLFLYGASGHGKVILDIALSQDIVIGGFIDNNELLTHFKGYQVTTTIPDNFDQNVDKIIIAIGNNTIRNKLYQQYAQWICEPLIHKSAIISKSAVIGKGSVIMPGVIINADAIIGENCIVNTHAVVEHDCVIGNHVHIASNATLGGHVHVGDDSWIGMGSNIVSSKKLDNNTILPAGTNVY